jgi:hypothetical protein
MIPASNPKLARFYRFFETYGAERLNGLDESYFLGLNGSEREEAWNFLIRGFVSSDERIKGLYILDDVRAIELFKHALALPVEASPYPEERRESESARLLMIRYINSVEADEKYVSAMSEFASSEFPRVRAEFAQSLPAYPISPEAVEALKRMIFTETERVPLSSAITKFMEIHGIDFDVNNPLSKSTFLSLWSGDAKEKLSAISRLEKSS